MNMLEIITKKRDGLTLGSAELKFVADGAADHSISDHQLSAFLMAVYFRGLDSTETALLTRHMTDTGERSKVVPGSVDKHSTGGVGDKTTLVIAPIAASCGVPVAKLSGRGLGFSGGTIDKLESIPGFRTSLSPTEFAQFVARDGIALASATSNTAPADKRLYAIRDVTATVESLPLIASSIMSKKLASGADAIVLDVKYGSGAFMKTPEAATELADAMIRIGRDNGRRMSAAVTSMVQPLGLAVGNALEVREALETLQGGGPSDFVELCVLLAAMMLRAANIAPTLDECKAMAQSAITSGRAMDKFRRMLENQGGDTSVIDHPERLAVSGFSAEIRAECDGFVAEIDGYDIGNASVASGAGRLDKDDAIDYGAGIQLAKKIGDAVKQGETLATVYASDETKLEAAVERAISAFALSESEVSAVEVVHAVIE